ncbi:hypothetical protein [endosymbiont of unidentified scaly snail isolate Monju]|uniref:hypothetical protein n=1 Tax=endosymbiont of unidentified scaly snail isolate Monju TaxID=1248727 RepID=UPI000389277F|nr:hypothetical protein [endosymbiont of unidentified scaly snail isolate Monju]BAN69211.1 hypothetical protein EBS_1310 [endosymbiont of unidentified scaly snail isolate Monju]
MLSSHKWEIGVSAGGYYPSLTQEFWGNDISLAYEDDHLGMQFYAFSYHIDELDDPEHVACRLFSLQLLLNGALRVAWNENFPVPVKFTHFALCEGGRQYSVHASNIENNPFSQNADIDRFEHSSTPAKGRLSSHILNLCKKDEVLRSLIFQVGLISLNSSLETIMTWGTLYKIYDSVRYHSKKNAYDFSKMGDPNRINQFTAACNSSLLLGVFACHGDMGWGQPAAAITDINEATSLIIDLAQKFCVAYINAQHP